MALAMDCATLNGFLDRVFPQISDQVRVESVDAQMLVARLRVDDRHLRPGGTVSGPTLFALADVGAWCAVLAHIGPVALAVTTNLSFNFMRKPAQADLLAEARLLKLGRSLAVGEVLIRNVSTDVMNRGFPRVDRNSFFIFEVTGRCIGHLGQLRHIPDAAQFAAVWWLDVLPMHWFSGALLEVFLAEIAD